MSFYSFAILDPRPTRGAKQNNADVFKGIVFGIKVTVPKLAERCVGNLDPQHSGGDPNTAAIEAACEIPLPEADVLATVRPDLDSIGAMAVLALRQSDWDLSSAEQRIAAVAELDKFSNKGRWEKKELPSRHNAWPEGHSAGVTAADLSAIRSVITDVTVPIEDRVIAMEVWLTSGEHPPGCWRKIIAERHDLIGALERGEITYELRAEGQIAYVRSTHRAATYVGYCIAPVVVAENPEHVESNEDFFPIRLITVCAYQAQYCDIVAALQELAKLEPGWAGSATIGDSPQNRSTALSVEQIVEALTRHLPAP